MLDKDQIAKIVSSAKAHPPSSHEVGVNLMKSVLQNYFTIDNRCYSPPQTETIYHRSLKG
jgi:hypothetical protein